MSSKSKNELKCRDYLENKNKNKNKELIERNISTILSNGIHCSYLLNTMNTNPSNLAYSNYTFANNNNSNNSNHQNQTTPSTSPTSPITPNSINQVIGPNPHHHQYMNNNINPLYIYSQNINHHYPQHEHHHYHLFQMAQHQQLTPYPMNTSLNPSWNPSLNPYTNNNIAQLPPVSTPYILNPYHPQTTTTNHRQCTQQTKTTKSIQNELDVFISPKKHQTNKVTLHPKLECVKSSKIASKIDLIEDAEGIEAKNNNDNQKENDSMETIFKQIVSIPDEFASAINDDFSEMIGMQHIDTKHIDTKHDTEITESVINDDDDDDDEINIDYDDEEFVCKRKEQIKEFLKIWDNDYPVTSIKYGEDEEYKEEECEVEEIKNAYNLPPGLHNDYGEPLSNKSLKYGEGDKKKEKEKQYSLQSASYTFRGSIKDAKIMGIKQNKWIMLNIQDTDLFTAQWSNPLIWKHKRYALIIKENFIFIDCIKYDENAINFINVYNIENIPSVVIIDPHTNLKRFEFKSPSSSTNIPILRQQILNLLNTSPNPAIYNNDSLKLKKNNPTKPTKPPIPHKYNTFIDTLHNTPPTLSEKSTSSASTPISPIPTKSRRCSKNKKKTGFHFTSSLEISCISHIYCNMDNSLSSNIWDLCYPYTNLKNNAYILSTRQTFDWKDWMLIIKKCEKIIGAIPSEQHIEFLRNRNGEMTLESSGTYNGWWSEKRIAEYVVNEKFGLSFEGGFASENGRERKKFLKSLELPRRPTFKKMLVIIPNIDKNDKILFHDNSLSITSYLEYDKMDNITSFQLWLSFITFLSVHMFETSNMYKNNQFKYNECTNFCIKLGSKWKLPLSTLYNDIEALINNLKCKNLLFSSPKIATDAHCQHIHGGNIINKYHHLSSQHSIDTHIVDNLDSNDLNCKKNEGFEISFLSKSHNNYKYDYKRRIYVKSYEELESALISTKSYEIIDFPFPLFSSGWFSFNTLSLFATILEHHLNGTWVSMFSLNSRKQFKQIFDINKNTRRRPIIYTKLLQQKINEENYKNNYINLSVKLSTKNKQRLTSFWNENKLYWTDLIIDPTNKTNKNNINNNNDNDDNKTLHKNHNNRNYRKKRKQRFRNRNRTKRKQQQQQQQQQQQHNKTDNNNHV